MGLEAATRGRPSRWSWPSGRTWPAGSRRHSSPSSRAWPRGRSRSPRTGCGATPCTPCCPSRSTSVPPPASARRPRPPRLICVSGRQPLPHPAPTPFVPSRRCSPSTRTGSWRSTILRTTPPVAGASSPRPPGRACVAMGTMIGAAIPYGTRAAGSVATGRGADDRTPFRRLASPGASPASRRRAKRQSGRQW